MMWFYRWLESSSYISLPYGNNQVVNNGAIFNQVINNGGPIFVHYRHFQKTKLSKNGMFENVGCMGILSFIKEEKYNKDLNFK